MENAEGRGRTDPEEVEVAMDGEEWSCKRLEITYQEARAVLEAQQSILADIDEKAMRTVRTTVLLVGAIASTVKIASINLHPVFATVGAVSLFGSLAFGLATYDETDPYLGPNQRYIDQLVANDFRETWERDLAETYGHWINENGSDIGFNGRLLRIAQTLLFTGIGFVTLSLVF